MLPTVVDVELDVYAVSCVITEPEYVTLNLFSPFKLTLKPLEVVVLIFKLNLVPTVVVTVPCDVLPK